MQLLSRNDFKNSVLNRDNYKCVVCNETAVDAHHIIERKLWNDEGYYIDNGASLCEKHHKLAETGHLCPNVIRKYAKITNVVVPANFDKNKDYDKWGNELKKPNIDNIKYPSTPHLYFSPTISNEDIEGITHNLKDFLNIDLILTTKMDGSNVKVTKDFVASRNGLEASHQSFDLLKKIHKEFSYKIPPNIILFGEWLYAKHSIEYNNLKSYLQIFEVFDIENNLWLSWNEIKKITASLGLNTVQDYEIININNEQKLISYLKKFGEKIVKNEEEGFVMRIANQFHYGQFSRFVAKYVRPNHVQTSQHWSEQKIIKNKEKIE